MRERNIFIGLGGSGVNTVAALKYKIYNNISSNQPFKTMEQNYKFLFCDTDQKDINNNNEYYKSKYESGQRLLIDPDNDLINLGTVNPTAVYKEATNKPIEKKTKLDLTIAECCSKDNSNALKNYPMSEGAGAFRYNSHIGFARMSDLFVNKLRECITQLSDTFTAGNEEVMLRYWVVGSSNGGTGSGIFLDVLYLINMLHKLIRNGEDPKTTLVLYMPRFYIDANKGDQKYINNAYAVFSEMNGFQAISRSNDQELKEMVHQMMFHPQNLQIQKNSSFSPFSSCIPIDIQTERGNSLMSPGNMYSNTAELLYFIHQSQGRDPLASSFKSDADNFLDDLVNQDPENFLQPMGYVALRKPEAEFDHYVTHRLRLEILNYGILDRFPEDFNLESEIEKIYNSIIHNELFNCIENSFSNEINQIVADRIKRSFSTNLLMDDDKPRKRLPSGISQVAADKIIGQFSMAIDDLFKGRIYAEENENSFSKEAVLNRIEEKLWAWVEEQTIQKGLNYVKQVLDGLDIYATEVLSDYMTGNGMESIIALSEKINTIQKQLPDLRQKAEEVTFSELIGLWVTNATDIRQYYNQLLAYIKANGEKIVAEKKYEILSELCKGDSGIIDKIRFYVNSLKVKAEEIVRTTSKEYQDLAIHFAKSSQDITTVYLPEISKFIKNGSWDPDNYFSKLYSEILEPSHTLVAGHGFIPVRTTKQSQEKSVESFLRKLIENNKKNLIAEGYYLENKENSHSMLFRKNKWSENPSKIIEDLLLYIERTYEKVYKSGTLADKWYNVTLEELLSRLTLEEQSKIKLMLRPQLFFSYNTATINNGREFNYVIAPSEKMAENIFRYRRGASDWKYDQSYSRTVAYMLKAKIGMPLSSYTLYETVQQNYREELNKELYHIHNAWGECSGVYTQLKLKERTEKELLIFARYLILNEYAQNLNYLFYEPENLAEKGSYKQTPLIIGEDSMAFALARSVDFIKDYVALHYDNCYYQEYIASDKSTLFSDIYHSFKCDFSEKRFENAMIEIMKSLGDQTDIKRNYNRIKDFLIQKLNDRWQRANREVEKGLLLKLIQLFNNNKELSDYEKFTIK